MGFRGCLVEALRAAERCEAIHEKELRFDLGTAHLPVFGDLRIDEIVPAVF